MEREINYIRGTCGANQWETQGYTNINIQATTRSYHMSQEAEKLQKPKHNL